MEEVLRGESGDYPKSLTKYVQYLNLIDLERCDSSNVQTFPIGQWSLEKRIEVLLRILFMGT